MKKISQEGLINKLKLLVNELIILGVDVHKRSYPIAIWSVQRGLMTTLIPPSSSAVLIKLITPFKKHIAQIVYEAGPTGFGLVRDLRASGFKADVIAPTPRPNSTHLPNSCTGLVFRPRPTSRTCTGFEPVWCSGSQPPQAPAPPLHGFV